MNKKTILGEHSMNNNAKKITNITAGAIGMSLGIMSCLIALFTLGIGFRAFLAALMILNVGVGVPLIVFGAKNINAPKVSSKVSECNRNAIVIAVCCFVLFFVTLFSSVGFLLSFLYLLNLLLSLPTGALALVARFLPEAPENKNTTEENFEDDQDIDSFSSEAASAPAETYASTANTNQAAAAESNAQVSEEVAQELERLEKWKGFGIITEEQYNESVAKLLGKKG